MTKDNLENLQNKAFPGSSKASNSQLEFWTTEYLEEAAA